MKHWNSNGCRMKKAAAVALACALCAPLAGAQIEGGAVYLFDDNVEDSSGNGNTLILQQGTELYSFSRPSIEGVETDMQRSALMVGGIYNVTDDTLNTALTSFTIEAWANKNASSTEHIAVKDSPGADLGGIWFFRLRQNDLINARMQDEDGDVLEIEVHTLNFGNFSFFGSWGHTALVVDRENDLASVYLNGALAASSNLSASAIGPADLLDNTVGGPGHPLWISGTPTLSGPVQDFSGTLDEVRLIHRALSADEIAADFARSLKRSPPRVLSETITDVTGLSFASQVGFDYVLQCAVPPDTNIWRDTGLSLSGTGGTLTMLDPTGYSASKDYRVLER